MNKEKTNTGYLFQFGKNNYILIGAGVLLILIGFFLMPGGASHDPNVFPKEDLYSFRRITLAPLLVMIGFIVEIFAIFRKSGD